MIKSKHKKIISLVLTTAMCLSAFMATGLATAFATSGERTSVNIVDYASQDKFKKVMEIEEVEDYVD